MIAGMALAGHVSSAQTPIHWWNYAGMAFHTAMGFVLLGSGLLALAKGEGGLIWSLDTFTTIGFAIGIVSLFAMAGSSYNVTHRLMETAKWVSHTQEVLKKTQEIASDLADLESKQRGYIITGDERQLDRREQTKASLQEDLNDLHKLIADNSSQQLRLKDVIPLIAQRNDFGDQTIEARRKHGFAAAEQMVSTNKGIALTDNIHQILEQMENEEYELLAVREKQSKAVATMTFLLLPLVVFLSVTLLCLGVFFLNTGIRERIRADDALRASEGQLRTIVENLDQGLAVSDLQGQLLHFNRAALNMHGFAGLDECRRHLTEFTDTFALSTLDGTVLPVEQWPLACILRGEKMNGVELRIRRVKTDWHRIFSYGGTLVYDADGRPLMAVVTISDISDRKQAQEAQKASDERLRFVTENARVGLVMVDRERRYTFANAAYGEILGLSSLDIVGQRVADVLASIYEEQIRPRLDRAFAGERVTYELLKPRLNEARYYSVKYEPTKVDGSVSFIVVVITDITERKAVEIALRDSNERFQQLAENIDEVFWITDPAKNQMVYISPAYEKIWVRSCESLYQSPATWLEAIHPEDREQIRLAAMTKQVRGEYDETYRILRPDGSLRWIRDRAFPLRNAAGEVFRVVGTASDITANRTLEQQFRQAQKMEAIGQLAGGVAHDFNNLLTVINGRSQLSMNRFKVGDKTRNDLELIYRTGERAAALTRQLLAFSRQQVLEPVVLDLNAVAADMDKMLRRLVREDIDLRTVFDPALKHVKADPGQIEQVIMNLVVNARDAMPNGGKLTIETANAELSEEYCSARSEVRPGHYAMLAVSDTGHGMDATVKARIFEPFFTTKPQGKGTGLGLATVFGVVKQSNGHIEVYSEVGKGTTFKIYLPQTQDKLAKTPSDSQLAVPQGQEVILVVEDEEGVRELVRDLLEMNGYMVLVANNGNEALQVCQTHKGAITLLVTDVVMPEMGGPELVKRIKVQYPGTKVLFTSGYTDHAIVRNGSLEAGVAFIQKPFTPANFARKVRDVIDKT